MPMSSQRSDQGSGQRIDPSSGQFIDPLFAIIIASGVAETFVKWVRVPEIPGTLAIASVSLGYVNLLLSWFGYHKSVRKKPIRGTLRFIVTVALLPLYLLTIILYDKPMICLAVVYAIIFFLWSSWEYLKFVEHNDKQGFWRLQIRLFNIPVYASCICLAVVPAMGTHVKALSEQYASPVALVLIVVSILWLRLVKSTSQEVFKIKDAIRELLFGADRRAST